MTFDLVRMGWPNTVAILALAIMPVVALTVPERHRPVVQTEQAETAAICPTLAECPQVAAVAAAETVVE